MNFHEPLPEKCPPAEASDQPLEGIYRLLTTEEATEESFASHIALGKEPYPTVCPCIQSACSLVYDPKKYKLLPRLKDHKWAAKLSIPKGAGLSLTTKNKNHVSFWRSQGFDIVSSVLEVVEI